MKKGDVVYVVIPKKNASYKYVTAFDFEIHEGIIMDNEPTKKHICVKIEGFDLIIFKVKRLGKSPLDAVILFKNSEVKRLTKICDKMIKTIN